MENFKKMKSEKKIRNKNNESSLQKNPWINFTKIL